MTSIPQGIKEAVVNNKLIIFAGSGLSSRFNLPSWVELVKNIINELDQSDYSDFLPLLSKGKMDPIDVLEYLSEEHTTIRKHIKKEFNIREGDYLLHKALIELSGKIITTNYDNAFENASGNTIIPTMPTSKFNVSEINKTDSNFIFKLHGDYSEPDNCILFKDDYKKLYSLDNASIEKLKSLFSDYTILFVGYSFNDSDINSIFYHLDEIFDNHNKHFIITKTPQAFKKFGFLERIEISNYSEIDSIIETFLKYKKENTTVKVEIASKAAIISPKIALLYANPIDYHLIEGYSNLISAFNELDAAIYIGAFNVRSLQKIDDFDLLIVLTKSFKGNLYIEEDNLKSNLVSIEEVCDNIPNDKIPLLLVTNERMELDINHPIVNIYNYKNSTINRFIFKTLKSADISFYGLEISSNLKAWSIEKFTKGEGKVYSLYTNKIHFLKRLSAANVIGRIEEQSIIAAKILNIKKTNKILNLKAAGGTGKTTLIKKVSSDLYERGYFRSGVSFISCENVKSYSDFEEVLINGFNLRDIVNFKEYLNSNPNLYDTLIIFDNFETVTNIEKKDDYIRVLELLEFATNYASLVITSRETLGIQSEDIYSLTPLITDDALELFISFYGKVDDKEEIRILRSDILEDLLNNNPLAIKLVTQSRTRYKNIEELKLQLQEHFFESINQDYSLIFKSNADLNIERTKSIYQSINYSYSTLNSLEKLAFEILNLFPDGISLNNFKKCFSKKNSSNNISDKELRVLRNKSLVEDNDGVLQLQPIIRRFAEFLFFKRPKDIKQKYYRDAFKFNQYILNLLDFVRNKKSHSDALRLFSTYRNNIMNVLTFFEHIDNDQDLSKQDFLNFVYFISHFIRNEKQIVEYQNILHSLSNYFSDLPYAELLVETINLNTTFYYKEFDNTYEKMTKILPSNEMEERIILNENYNEKAAKNLISNVHSMEGFTLQFVNLFLKNNNTSKYLRDHLFFLGITDRVQDGGIGFYAFQYDLLFDELNATDVENFIDSLYVEDHLQLMQCYYVLSKLTRVDLKRIKKLVVTNPYTNGLKELMYAFNKSESVKSHYEDALSYLFHIKYYYLEALYFYCVYLKRIGSPEYYLKYSEGLELSNRYFYQHLAYKFNALEKPSDTAYHCDYSYYPLESLKSYVVKHNDHWKKEFKSSVYND